jgi:hypothetical protein
MASRFPSIEEFDDGAIEVPTATVMDLDDPAADFLSREKATLGADAELFATEDDNNLLGGGSSDAVPAFERSFPSLDTPQVGSLCRAKLGGEVMADGLHRWEGPEAPSPAAANHTCLGTTHTPE